MRKPLTFSLHDAQKLEPLTDRVQRLDGLLDPRGPDAAASDAMADFVVAYGQSPPTIEEVVNALLTRLKLRDVWSNARALADLCGLPAPTPDGLQILTVGRHEPGASTIHYVPSDFTAADLQAAMRGWAAPPSAAYDPAARPLGVTAEEWAAHCRTDNGELPTPPAPDPFFVTDRGPPGGWKNQEPVAPKPDYSHVRIGHDAANPNNRRIYVGPGEGSQWAKVYGQDPEMANARAGAIKAALERPIPPPGVGDTGHAARVAAGAVDELREALRYGPGWTGSWEQLLEGVRELNRKVDEEADAHGLTRHKLAVALGLATAGADWTLEQLLERVRALAAPARPAQ